MTWLLPTPLSQKPNYNEKQKSANAQMQKMRTCAQPSRMRAPRWAPYELNLMAYWKAAEPPTTTLAICAVTWRRLERPLASSRPSWTPEVAHLADTNEPAALIRLHTAQSSLPRASLLSRVAGPLPTRMGDPIQPSTFPPSPFLRSVGFHALLPVIVQQPGVQLWAADDSAPLTADGDIDFTAHELYIFASGRWFGAQPSWSTTLVRREFFLTRDAVIARAQRTSLNTHPTTEAELESLLRDPSKAGRATSFIDRVHFTPPEIRCEFHNHALEWWAEIKRENTKRFEPPPSKPVNTWRSWLKQMHEDATERGRSFIYCGIPRFEDEYQDTHIEDIRLHAATIGVTAEEAETWRPWAMAYIAMELEKRPHSKYAANLTRARDAAHAIIDNDPKWVITDVHPESVGNYNPATAKTRAERRATQNPEDHTEAGPSRAGNTQNSYFDTVKEVDIEIANDGLHDVVEDSEAMGPTIY
ncbi:hypothetical protein BC826DRAFT_975106 [Russula brevipes]|nr:hypothetical protein BC826DRAFT_975106 [Russula brevipes]